MGEAERVIRLFKRWKDLDKLECVKEHGLEHKIAHIMGTNSISKCTSWIGRFAMQGFIDGIERQEGALSAEREIEIQEWVDKVRKSGVIEIEEPKKKFVLEFDEAPALVFVSQDGNRNEVLYVNGEVVKGCRSITIRAGVDEFTTHEIEYVTAAVQG